MLKLKSLKEPPSRDDGLRIMIARYGIRGQKKNIGNGTNGKKKDGKSWLLHLLYLENISNRKR